MIASATPEDYGQAIGTVAADPNVDAMIAIYIPPLESDAPAVADGARRRDHPDRRRIPVLTCFMSSRGLPDALRAPGLRIPSFAYPEQAAIALAHATELGVWRAKPEGHRPVVRGARGRGGGGDRRRADARRRVAHPRRGPRPARLLRGAHRTAGCVRPHPRKPATRRHRSVATVALKAIGPVHKTESGAVVLDLSPDDVLESATAMAERVIAAGEPFDGFLVQEMVAPGVEMLVGAVADPVFGPVIAVGAGGVTVELTRDVAVRVAPLTDLDADEMVRSLATFPLLDGFRGAEKADVAALTDVVLRLGAIATAHDAIAEMDCNPVIVQPRRSRRRRRAHLGADTATCHPVRRSLPRVTSRCRRRRPRAVAHRNPRYPGWHEQRGAHQAPGRASRHRRRGAPGVPRVAFGPAHAHRARRSRDRLGAADHAHARPEAVAPRQARRHDRRRARS